VRYPPNHGDETKARIVSSARKLFNRFGFDAVSIEQIMANANLTVGGFYRHFASKSDLYAEVLQCFFTDPGWSDSWEGVHIDMRAADIGRQIIRAYLSPQHLKEIENACPMVALPSDVARSGESAKRAYEAVFKAMVAILEQGACGAAKGDRSIALAITALCVGGMVTARAIEDRQLADELLGSARAVALTLGGWPGDALPEAEKS
jgi:TetR/AcrR family transcriptional regulator, transcriptional repressor for nem operon